jgi:hypothetical protein
MTEHRALLGVLLAGGAAVILPVPPIPPAGGPPDHPAPIPSLTVEAPGQDQVEAPGQDRRDSVRLAPSFFSSLGDYNASEGYTPGSRIEELPGRRDPVRAGFSLSVPIQ